MPTMPPCFDISIDCRGPGSRRRPRAGGVRATLSARLAARHAGPLAGDGGAEPVPQRAVDGAPPKGADAGAEGELAPAHQPSPADRADAVERRSRIRAALDRLPERERELLLLRAEGYSYRDLAEILNLNEASVGTLLGRAKRAFQAAWEGE